LHVSELHMLVIENISVILFQYSTFSCNRNKVKFSLYLINYACTMKMYGEVVIQLHH
jgi:hypothetical protein